MKSNPQRPPHASPRRASPSNPIGARLLALALAKQDALLAALEETLRRQGLPPARVGLLLLGEHSGLPLPPSTVLAYPRERLWSITRRLGLDVPTGCPDFFPVLVADRGEACLCWLGPLPAPGGLPS